MILNLKAAQKCFGPHSKHVAKFILTTTTTTLLLLQPFNSLFSRTTCVSWHQKGRTIVDFNNARFTSVNTCGKRVQCCNKKLSAAVSAVNVLKLFIVATTR